MHDKTPWNPSRKATARVRDPLPAPCACHYCGGEIEIRHHDAIYGRAYGEWPWAYVCVGCGAYVGMHPFTNIPLGTLADQSTREARKVCKPHFERLWESGRMTRSDAYHWLADKLGISIEKCHWGLFDVDTCRRARDLCAGLMGAIRG